MAPAGKQEDTRRGSQESWKRRKSSNIEIMPMSSSHDGSEAVERILTPRPITSATEKEQSTKGNHLPHDLPGTYIPHPDDILPNTKRNRWLFFLWLVRYVSTICIVGFLLVLPAIGYRKNGFFDDDETPEAQQYRNLIFYLFLWFTTTWLAACIFDIVAMLIPYVYRFVMGYINPAHRKYWRVLKTMRLPIMLLGAVAACFIAFDGLIYDNDELAINYIKREPNTLYWDDALDNILQQITFWTAAYFIEKIAILYISIHYHYRVEENSIKQSKRTHAALVTLYEASIYLHPVGKDCFKKEDTQIANATGQGQDSLRLNASKFLRKVGLDGVKLVQFFGNLRFENHKSHWIKPNAPYAIVERALMHPKYATALAKRIWMSLVAENNEALTVEDIAEVLGPYRREEAQDCFEALDENESENIRLEEFVWTVIEAGRVRRAVYQGMADMDHCINTFDWVTLLMLATVMVFWILIIFVPTLSELQNTAAALAIGLSFAVGRSFHKYLLGCVLVFFEHPYDVGDRVQIYNRNDTFGVSAIVIRQSILYTVFRRIDNGTNVQITNLVLDQRRIENVTRSGANIETRSVFVDFKTTFQEITALQHELEDFLSSKENARDYHPELQLDVVNIFELNKMELRLSFSHKSNWSNERLRAARSSKFMCALIAAIRKLAVKKPNFMKQGDPDRPIYQVHMQKKEEEDPLTDVYDDEDEEDDEIAEKRRAKEEEEQRAKLEKKEAEEAARRELSIIPELKKTLVEEAYSTAMGVQVRDYIGPVTTGLRTRTSTGAEMMFYPSR